MTRAHPTLAWIACTACVVLALGCGGGALVPEPTAECTASGQAIDAYVARLADIASNHARSGVIGAHETADVSFRLGADGSASDFKLMRASRAAVGDELLRAAAEAAPYPRPPFDPKACLVASRATIGIIGHTRCDEARAETYAGEIVERMQQRVRAAGIQPTQHEKVTLRVKIDRSGALGSVTVKDADSSETGERIAAAARTAGPFEAPDESIAECVADLPIFVFIDLPGETRPPIRVR